MKKRLLALLMATAMVFSLAACGSDEKTPAADDAAVTDDADAADEDADDADAADEDAADDADAADEDADDADAAADDAASSSEGAEIALVTDLGTIDDKSFNQGAWEGVVEYGEENDISYKYYQPTEKTTDAYVETIDLAIEGGAKIVVCPGYLFEEAVFTVQDSYPEISFIILDGEPHDAEYEYRTESNVMAILYQEDEAGFLAGYAAVKEGYEKFGFMGGMAVPAVIRFGHGYVQGIEYAAEELGLDSVDVFYHYTGGFTATPEAQALAASWYENDVDVIFGCGGAVGNSVMSAAESANGAMIGVDVDQSPESDTVITSAMKQLSNSVYEGIKAFYADEFPGGETTVFSAENDGVGLPMDTSKFENFTMEDYEAVYEKIVSGEITINNDTAADVTELELNIVNVNVVE